MLETTAMNSGGPCCANLHYCKAEALDTPPVSNKPCRAFVLEWTSIPSSVDETFLSSNTFMEQRR